jgi:hypothetical protein
VPAVPAALELQHLVPARKSPSYPHRRERGLAPCRLKANRFAAGDRLHDGFRQADGGLVQGEVRRAQGRLALHRLHDFGPAMAQQQGPAPQHVVEVFLACGVVDLAPLTAHHHHAKVRRQRHHAEASARYKRSAFCNNSP